MADINGITHIIARPVQPHHTAVPLASFELVLQPSKHYRTCLMQPGVVSWLVVLIIFIDIALRGMVAGPGWVTFGYC